MLYELFLIMVFAFIIYHFYINVTNYLNVGAPFVEGLQLINKGWLPKLPSGTKLKKCEGDCDRDSDCEKDLKCFQRNKKEKVPGCESGGNGDKKGVDFCYNPMDMPPKSTWKSGGTCPTGCKKPICMDGNCKVTSRKGKQYKACSGTCKNYNGEAGCRYDKDCSAKACGITYFNPSNPNNKCKQNKKWDNSGWNKRVNQKKTPQSEQLSQQPSSYSLTDSSTSTFQRIVPNKQQQPSTTKIVSKEVIIQVLKNKHLVLGGYNTKTYDYNANIGVGKRFITEMSIVRNLSVPRTIEDTEYATIGENVIHFVNKKQPRHQKILIRNLKTILGGNRLASSTIDSSTTPKICTSKKTTGMFNDNCNRLIKTNNALCSKINKECSPNMKKGLTGTSSNYIDAYKPVDDAQVPKPYDSVWG